MRKTLFAALAAIALVLPGCATIGAVATAGATTVSPATMVSLQKAAYEAKLGFNAALILAVAYIELPRCGRATSPAWCSQQSVVDVMRKSIVAADSGTQAAEDAARSLTTDTTVLGALVTAAEKSVTALKTITPTK